VLKGNLADNLLRVIHPKLKKIVQHIDGVRARLLASHMKRAQDRTYDQKIVYVRDFNDVRYLLKQVIKSDKHASGLPALRTIEGTAGSLSPFAPHRCRKRRTLSSGPVRSSDPRPSKSAKTINKSASGAYDTEEQPRDNSVLQNDQRLGQMSSLNAADADIQAQDPSHTPLGQALASSSESSASMVYDQDSSRLEDDQLLGHASVLDPDFRQ
jgi:hypothetical protein